MIKDMDYWQDMGEQLLASLALARQWKVGVRVAWMEECAIVRPAKDVPAGLVDEVWQCSTPPPRRCPLCGSAFPDHACHAAKPA